MTTPGTGSRRPPPLAANLPAGPPGSVGSQTLDRGLRVLSVVAAGQPMTVADIAAAVGLHRSITYRMVRTLEHHDLLERDQGGRYGPGGGLAVLAGRVAPRLQQAARPALEDLTESVHMTAFLVVAHGDQAVTVLVVEPRSTLAHVAYRPGARHPLTLGAPGLAILAGRAPAPGERAEVTAARARGWARSESEVIPGYRSVAAGVRDPSGAVLAAVAVVYVGAGDEAATGAQVAAAAGAVSQALG